jgi:hypothetical protein
MGKDPSAFIIEECRKLGLIFDPWGIEPRLA